MAGLLSSFVICFAAHADEGAVRIGNCLQLAQDFKKDESVSAAQLRQIKQVVFACTSFLTLMKGDEGVEAAEKGANLLLLFDVNR